MIRFVAAFSAVLIWAALTVVPAAAADKVVLMLNWYVYGEHAPFYYGKAKGIYPAENIDLEIQEGRGSAATTQAALTQRYSSLGIRTHAGYARSPRSSSPRKIRIFQELAQMGQAIEEISNAPSSHFLCRARAGSRSMRMGQRSGRAAPDRGTLLAAIALSRCRREAARADCRCCVGQGGSRKL